MIHFQTSLENNSDQIIPKKNLVCLVCDWPNGNPPVSQTTQRGKRFFLGQSQTKKPYER